MFQSLSNFVVIRSLAANIVVLLALLAPTTANAAQGEIFIEFMARPTAPIREGTPGHAFFCISLSLNNGSKEQCFGFYPENLLKAFDGPGKVDSEFNRDAILNVSVSVRHKISETTRAAIYREIQRWAGTDYKLLVNNCGDLVFAVARVAGMRTPNRQLVTLPTEFVQGLKDLYWAGRWGSTDIGTRFSLAIENSTVEWTERNPETGQRITKSVALSLTPLGARIERANTADVLRALGFQASIIPDIIAAGPKPSFLVLTRQDSRISGRWSGLVVIKDNQGNFKELRQPGTAPPRDFEFDRLP